MTFLVPIRTRSLTNLRWHWSKKAKMAKEQRAFTAVAYATALGKFRKPLSLPVTVTLTRIAPRMLDAGDNDRSALKHVRDQIAACLALDDRDPRIEWRYSQEKGKPKTYAVRVTIENALPFLDGGDPTPEQLARWKGRR